MVTQLSKGKVVLYHFYPGILITIGFVVLAPVVIEYGYPPQFAMLGSIALVAVPVLILHLKRAAAREGVYGVGELNGYTAKLPFGRLILYCLGLVLIAFVIWGLTQPLNKIIGDRLLGWLPAWYTLQDFAGYDPDKIKTTVMFNLVLNGLIAPYLEELYFRGYLLPRMETWGKRSFMVSALLFSLYHFWQPYLYITIFLSLIPMTYVVYKTKDLRIAIVTHCLLNLIGAILTFGLLAKK